MVESIERTAAHSVLVEMVKAKVEGRYEEAVITCHGLDCWLDERRIARRTVLKLLRLMAVSHDADGGSDRYTLNGVGEALAADPTLAPSLIEALRKGEPFTVSDGRIVPLEDPHFTDTGTSSPSP